MNHQVCDGCGREHRRFSSGSQICPVCGHWMLTVEQDDPAQGSEEDRIR